MSFRIMLTTTVALLCCGVNIAGFAQQAESQSEKIERLTAAVVQAQSQMEAYRHQLEEVRRELEELRQQAASAKQPTAETPSPPKGESPDANPSQTASSSSLSNGTTLEDLQERMAIAESQIATHERTKVETESKYSLKVSGLILFNGFVNTRRVDQPASPAYVLNGSGSTGLSIRQTILGLDARGPHLMGGESYGNLRVDFFANGSSPDYSHSGVVRLRTAHAGLQWKNTEAFVMLDHTILAPYAPSSLVAMAQPELAWSGFLWNWNPQVGITQRIPVSTTKRLNLQAALMDEADPQLPNAAAPTSTTTSVERSRWPAVESRISYTSGVPGNEVEVGVGGYWASHRTLFGHQYTGWAGTADVKVPVGHHFEFIANVYRGQALGGLGGGGYSNTFESYAGNVSTLNPLSTIGGFAQLKSTVNQRLQFNTGFGIDNPFANEIREQTSNPDASNYSGLARNRTYFGNAIYSPSRYLVFSLEYRRMWSSYASGATYPADIIGLGAGYKF